MPIEFHRSGPWELPEGWVWVRLGDLVSQRGEKAAPDKSSPFPFIGMDDVPPNSLRIETMGAFSGMKSAGNKFYPNDILYGRLRPYLNKVVVPNIEGVASGEFIVMRAADGIAPRYLQLFMHARRFINLATADTSGDRPRIDFDKIVNIEIPLAPTAEQCRIVTRIEELLAEISDGEAVLGRARDDLDTWRRSLLKAAVTGELTRDWREQNRIQESASELLARVEIERSESVRTRSSIDTPVDTSELPKLPETWAWARARQLCGFITKGTTPGRQDFCSSDDDGVPFIKVYNLTTSGELDFTVKPSFVRSDIHHGFLARSIVKPNDVLMNIVGPPLGKVSIVPDSYSEWNCNQAIAIFRPIIVSPEFLALVLSSEVILRWATNRGKASVGQINLTLEICRDLPIPVPPISEQNEILESMGEQTSTREAAEKYLLESTLDSSKLRQSVLKVAFEGRLVEPDPLDEPASRLLERLGKLIETRAQPRRTRRAALAAE